MLTPPKIFLTPKELHAELNAYRAAGQTLGFVPTMGALHAGHAALIDVAKRHCDKVLVSIFVNPKQFGEGEDFSRYPRMVDKDVLLLTDHGADVLFLPDAHVLYPEGFSTTISVKGASDVLDGVHRPGHFDGVATVVAVLLNLAQANMAFFGEKDYQQLTIIRQMVKDLHLSSQIIAVPTVREVDGLALSSRNQYLSEEERAIAPLLHHVMQSIREGAGKQPLAVLCEAGKQQLLEAGFRKIDYLEVRHEETLEPSESAAHSRLFAAAWLGTTRLIDNIDLG